MKINLVSGTTYFPTKAGDKSPIRSNQTDSENLKKIESFKALISQKLSPDEASAIQKLFGDFKLDEEGKLTADPENCSEFAHLGRFVDITI